MREGFGCIEVYRALYTCIKLYMAVYSWVAEKTQSMAFLSFLTLQILEVDADVHQKENPCR
jgi:hypothetical protein